MLIYQYCVITIPLLLLYHIISTCSHIYLNINTSTVIHQLYRSIVCGSVSLAAAIITIVHWQSSPFTKSLGIHAVNQTMIGFLALDVCLMAYHRNTRLELWAHHVFCLATYVIMVEYFDHSNLLLAMMSMGESLSIMSGVDALLNVITLNVITFNKTTRYNQYSSITKWFRMGIIVFVRFPLWLYLAYITVHFATPLVVRINSAIGVYVMILMDAHWFKRCHCVVHSA